MMHKRRKAGDDEGNTKLARRYTFKLYPNAAQAVELERQRLMHCALYNGLLQQRLEAYARQRKTLTCYDQSKEITALRADDAEYRALSRASMDATSERLELAFRAFFRRWKAIKTNPMVRQAALERLTEKNVKRRARGKRLVTLRDIAGFPRYQASKVYPSIPFKAEKTGWAFDLKGARAGGHRLRLQGVPGLIRARGKLPAPALSKLGCAILWRDETWWLSLVVAMEPRRRAGEGKGEVEFDLLTEFAVVRAADGGRESGRDDPQGDERRTSQCSEGLTVRPVGSPHVHGETTGSASVESAGPPVGSPHVHGETTGWHRGGSAAPWVGSPHVHGETTGRRRSVPASPAVRSPHERGETTGIVRVATTGDRVGSPYERGETTGWTVLPHRSPGVGSPHVHGETTGIARRGQRRHRVGPPHVRGETTGFELMAPTSDLASEQGEATGELRHAHGDLRPELAAEQREAADSHVLPSRPSPAPEGGKATDGDAFGDLGQPPVQAAEQRQITEKMAAAAAIEDALRQRIARCHKGSLRYRRRQQRLAKHTARVARSKREQQHEWTTGIARRFADLTVIAPASLMEATASAAGTEREHGAKVAVKAEVNRKALGFGAASAIAMLNYKITEAGGTFIRVDADEDQPLVAAGKLVAAAKVVKRANRSIKRAERAIKRKSAA